MTDLQRIKIAVKTLISLGVGKNQEEIGKLLGYSNKSSFSQVINGSVGLPSDFIERLANLNSTINKEWLKTGNGDLLETNTNKVYNSYSTVSENTNTILKGKALPLIDVEDIMEYNKGNGQILNHDAPMSLIPFFTGSDYLINVKGSSMSPKYNSGDIIACKHLPLGTFFQWNKVYVLNTEQGLLIKRICKSENEDSVTIVSENKDYTPFELHKSEILSIAIVTGVIRLE